MHRFRPGLVFVLTLLLVMTVLSGCGDKSTSETKPAESTPTAQTKPAEAKPAESKAVQAPAPKTGGTLRFAAVRDSTSFDPHKSGGVSNDWLLGSIYENLIEADGKGGFVGAMAESYEQPDSKTYVFKLRKGVQFHDGTPFDAEDVLATVSRIRDPKAAANHKATMDGIEKIEAPDPFTVRITLKSPSATFLHALASNSAYVVSDQDVKSGFEFSKKVNGTGAFTLGNWEPQRRYVLKKNPNYYKKGQPYLDELIITIVVDDKARIDALRSGEMDVAEYIPWQDIAVLSKDYGIHTHYDLQSFVRLNQSQPPLDNKKVRQALAYVVDRQEVLDLAFGGQGQIMTGPLQPQGSPFYFKELEGYYKKDWDKAKALLKEAGYNSPADVPPLSFQVTTTAISHQPAQVIQQQFQKFGLKIDWKTIDVPTLQKNRREGSYVVHMDGGGMAWPDPDYLRSIFHSTFGTGHANGVKYKNDRLDQLLVEGVETSDLARRQQIYLEVEKIILDEVPWIFVLWRPQTEATAKYVKGFVNMAGGFGSMNVNRFEHIWLDK